MKKCPKCDLNFIANTDQMCSVCKTAQPIKQTRYPSKDRFYIINKQTYYDNREGYLIFDDEDRNVGIVFMSDVKGQVAYGHAEIRFFDGYRREFGVWRRIFINGDRLPFTRLQNILEKDGRYNCLLDPR